MAAYYNEIEPFAVHVLKQLIRDGVIADGDVDDRSIVDVQPEDLRGYTQCHFFAGAALWSVAARMAGWPDDRLMWTGSCPCQPFSVAGKGAGTEDPRHLWPHFFRLIRSCRPSVVLGEQVAGKAGYGWFDGVRSDLEGEGYASRAVDIPACAINAPHIRQRLYWVAKNMGLADGAGWDARQLAAEAARHGDPVVARSGGCVVADAESIGRRGRPHDEDEGRREQPFADPCEGSGDMVDAASIGRGEGRSEHELRSGRPAITGAGGGDMADTDDERPQGVGSNHYPSGWKGQDIPQARLRNGAGFWDDAEWRRGADGKERRVKSGVCLLVDAGGCIARVHQLRLAGNAIVAPLAAEVIKALM